MKQIKNAKEIISRRERERERERERPAPLEAAPWMRVRGTMRGGGPGGTSTASETASFWNKCSASDLSTETKENDAAMSNRITFILTTLFTLSHPLLCFVLFIYTETETTIIDHWCFFSLFIYLLFIVTNKRGNISILLRNLVPMSAATLLLLLSVPFCFCLIIFPMCLINLHLLSSIFSLFCPNQTNYLLSFFLSLL